MSLVSNIALVIQEIGSDIKNILSIIQTKQETITPGAGWSGTVKSIRKLGRIKIKGNLTSSVRSVELDSVLCTLSADYRPSVPYYTLIWYSGGLTGFGMIVGLVEPSGNIIAKEYIPSTTNLQIEGEWDID